MKSFAETFYADKLALLSSVAPAQQRGPLPYPLVRTFDLELPPPVLLSEELQQYLYGVHKARWVAARITEEVEQELRKSFAVAVQKRCRETGMDKRFNPFIVLWLFVAGGSTLPESTHKDYLQQCQLFNTYMGQAVLMARMMTAQSCFAAIDEAVDSLAAAISDLVESI